MSRSSGFLPGATAKKPLIAICRRKEKLRRPCWMCFSKRGIFLRTLRTGMWFSSAGTKTESLAAPTQEAWRIKAAVTCPARTNPAVFHIAEAAINCSYLKRRLICFPSSACIRTSGCSGAMSLSAACPAKPLTAFSLNAGTFGRCSSTRIMMKPEMRQHSGLLKALRTALKSFAFLLP